MNLRKLERSIKQVSRLLALASISLLAQIAPGSENQHNLNPNGRIGQLVAEAQEKHETHITVPPSIVEYPDESKGVSDLVPHYSVVVGTPTQVVVRADDQHIVTHYRFTILEVLSPGEDKEMPLHRSPGQLFDKPLADNEFYLSQNGGTVQLEGIVVQEAPVAPRYVVGKRYLMFVSISSSHRGAYLAGGPQGAFLVDDQDKIRPSSSREYPLRQDLTSGHGDLTQLRNEITNHPR